MSKKELYDLAEKYYLGRITTRKLVETVKSDTDIERLKVMLICCMHNTAVELCSAIDNAKEMIETTLDQVNP